MRKILSAMLLAAAALAGGACHATYGYGYHTYAVAPTQTNQVYVNGYWYPDAYGNWAWADGYYVPSRPGYHFYQGYWSDGYYHRPYWQGPHGEVVIHEHARYNHPEVRVSGGYYRSPPPTRHYHR